MCHLLNATCIKELKKMVSRDKYPCLCQDSEGLSIFESKTNQQQYIKCKSGCGFFVQANEFANYMTVLQEKVKPEYKTRNPLCNHQTKALLLVSKSDKNPGRPFFKCNEKGVKCNFFQWGDEVPYKATLHNWTSAAPPAMVDKSTMTDQFTAGARKEEKKRKKPINSKAPKERKVEATLQEPFS